MLINPDCCLNYDGFAFKHFTFIYRRYTAIFCQSDEIDRVVIETVLSVEKKIFSIWLSRSSLPTAMLNLKTFDYFSNVSEI